MAAKTYAQQLEEVETAITAICNGAQAVSIDDITYTKANLKALFDERKRLVPLANMETNETGKHKVGYVFPEW